MTSVLSQGLPDHRDTRSFPTRRSSDLCRLSCHLRCERSGLTGSLETNLSGRGQVGFKGRSEEHTSDLQSRFELVCRLLLEKKKPNTEITRAQTNDKWYNNTSEQISDLH